MISDELKQQIETKLQYCNNIKDLPNLCKSISGMFKEDTKECKAFKELSLLLNAKLKGK